MRNLVTKGCGLFSVGKHGNSTDAIFYADNTLEIVIGIYRKRILFKNNENLYNIDCA
jgi:hypothetical protein